VNVRLPKQLKWKVDYGPEDRPGAFLATPKWDDLAAVTRWVCERVDYDDFASIEFNTSDPLESFKALEREAVAAAKNGNFDPLGALLEVRQFYWKDFHVGPEAEALAAFRIKNPRGGKRGRPKQTAEERQLQELGNPVHAAACEVKAVEKWFREYFPRERGRHDRAVAIAAERHGIKQKRLIANYLRSRHRL
jgi:hypothetical protein